MATIATLEIAPIHASDGWLLTVAVEDETGPPVVEGEEKIDRKSTKSPQGAGL